MTQRKPSRPNGSPSSDQRLTFLQPYLSREEAFNRGVESAQLLKHEVYNLAYRSAIQGMQDEWMDTKPEEVKKREWLYHKIAGLSAAQTELHSYLVLAQSISNEQQQQENYVQQQNEAAVANQTNYS